MSRNAQRNPLSFLERVGLVPYTVHSWGLFLAFLIGKPLLSMSPYTIVPDRDTFDRFENMKWAEKNHLNVRLIVYLRCSKILL